MNSDELKSLLQVNSPFRNYEAYKTLQNCASTPIDLNQPDQLTSERLTHFVAEACGYKLLFGTERVTNEVMSGLEQLSQETHALEKMQKMQAGEIMNFVERWPSENRPALHTALRDVFESVQKNNEGAHAAQLARQELNKLKEFIAILDREQKFDTLITIGIGGSDLGPRAHYYALESHLKQGRSVHFISNVDPDDTAAVLRKVDLKKTLIIVISKSGTTLETQTNEALVRAKFAQKGIDPYGHFISITMPGTPMDNAEHYAKVFYIWDWVGGRYSTTSMVGAVMLSFAFGFDIFMQFLKGAHEMDQVALNTDMNTNLPLVAALIGIWNRNFLELPTLAIIPYAEPLKRFTAHLQQLDMESNGKLLDQNGKFSTIKTGPVIWGEPGTNSQHSFFQLLHQGNSTVPVSFIGFKKSQYGEDLDVQGTTSQEKFLSNLFAQSLALALGNKPQNPNQFCPGNRPNHILLGEQLTPFALGALLAFYEHKVAFQGFIWGINSFDQQGVQLGKVVANEIIDLFKNRRNKTENTEKHSLAETYLSHLNTFKDI